MKKPNSTPTPAISCFVLKLSKLLEDSRFKEIITWSPDGTSITIDSHNEVLDAILAKYFKHTKISSFVRQLNLYGFKKVSQSGSLMVYKHQNFIKDQMNLRRLIKRKKKIKTIKGRVENGEEKIQNPALERQKSKIKGLQDIYLRIKQQNEKIQNQTQQFKTQTQELQQIKDSTFFTSLKNDYSQQWTISERNYIYQNPVKSFSNQQQSTPETETVQREQLTKNSYNSDCYYTSKKDGENGQNQDCQENQNDLQMFRQKYEEIDCEKNSMNPGRQASFWKQDQEDNKEREYK